MNNAPYKNPELSIEERVNDLMSRMTLEEKVGQMVQLPVFDDVVKAVREQAIGSILCGVDEDLYEAQKAAVEETRLGIPLLVGIDAIHGHSMEHNATMFPTQLGMACAWDEELCERVARATAREMAYTGCHWTFSPVFCMARDARWGRVNETFGEDRYIIGKLGAAMVRGYQGKSLSDPESVAACAKHFAGYGETQGGREASESDHSERKMRAVFLPPFEEAAKAGVASFMTAYQIIDGVPCTANDWLLKTILRDEWNSDALVVTDWGNCWRLHAEQFVTQNSSESSAVATNAGNDMMMTPGDYYARTLENVNSGKIPMENIDAAVRRILSLKFKLGLFENPRYYDLDKSSKIIGCDEHRKLALEAAEKSAVLLKNDNLLPLRRDAIKRIAVIGPNSDDDLQQLGDWSLGAGQLQGVMQRHERRMTKTLLDGILAEYSDKDVVYARGCSGRITSYNASEIAHAVEVAKSSDVVILQVGDHLDYIGEWCSTATLELLGGQNELFAALNETGVPVVVVFTGSRPLIITEHADKARAILCMFSPGMEAGEAAANIISGKVNPQGRLPITFPRHVGQIPVYYNQPAGAHQEHYADMQGKGFFGVFPFGFGLSYTQYQYRFPTLEKNVYKHGENVKFTVRLRNQGNYEGVETVQVYMRDCVSSVSWPRKNLIAWKKVNLKPREEKFVEFELPYESFAIVNRKCETVVESGDFEILVGSSSKNSDLKTLKFKYE